MAKRGLSNEEIHELLLEMSDEEEVASEIEDHISESELTSDDDTDDESDQSMIQTETLLSKDGKIEWKSEPQSQTLCGRRKAENILNMTPGPTKYATSRIEDEYSAFMLFFSPAVMNIILKNSNIEGKNVFGDRWKDLNNVDLEAFVGLLLLSGVYKSRNESTKSLWDATTGRSIFRATMSLEKFKMISKVLRFDDRQTRQKRRVTDKFAAIRDLWDKWVEILPMLYNPEMYVTVDEQLVAFRGKCPFRQYMPSKPAKYGIKFWVLCDNSTSYVWNIQPYLGKPPGSAAEKNQGLRVVNDLVHGLKGHNVTCDNFFTSYDLGQLLLKKQLTMIGTIRKNKPTIPPQLLQKNVPKFSSTFAFTKDTTLVSYIPKKGKCVVLQSTLHHDRKIADTETKKPEMILDYNNTKGGVDTLDKLASNYSCRRKTNRWPIIVFYNILDISAINAFVLFLKINPTYKMNLLHKRRLFIEKLGLTLVTQHIEGRKHLPRAKAARELAMSIQISEQTESLPEPSGNVATTGKRGRCHLCTRTDNKSSVKCFKCEQFTCKKHFIQVCNNCM